MSATIPEHLTAICPHCGARAKAHARHAGQRARCRSCREAFRIPTIEQARAAEELAEAHRQPAPEEEPMVGFGCRLCQTWMSVPQKYVGRKVKCPDCGTATVVPEPEAPRAPDIPSALSGEQYEVYEEEDQPWAADLAADQPRLLPVLCGHCQTLMHATPEQVGERLTCPDCGVRTVVPEPEAAPQREDVLVDPYDIDPPEVVDALPEVTRAYLDKAQQEAAEEVAREAEERPVMPRAPLLTGVFGYLGSEGMLAKHGGFAIGLALIGLLLADSVPGMLAFDRAAPTLVNAAAFLSMMLIILSACFLILWTGAFAVVALGLVTESSEGNHRYHGVLPANPVEWFPEGTTLAMAATVATAPGWIVAVTTPLPLAAKAGVLAAGFVLLFPVVTLSQLDLGSPLALVSPKLFASVGRVAGSWLLFLAQSAVIAAAVLGCAALVAQFRGWAVAPVAPVLVALGLLYFRLLGRLAWVIAERTEGSTDHHAAGEY